jgi:hypothetical protein
MERKSDRIEPEGFNRKERIELREEKGSRGGAEWTKVLTRITGPPIHAAVAVDFVGHFGEDAAGVEASASDEVAGGVADQGDGLVAEMDDFVVEAVAAFLVGVEEVFHFTHKG